MTITTKKRKKRKGNKIKRRSSSKKRIRKIRKYSLLALSITIIGIALFFFAKKHLPIGNSFNSEKYFIKGIDISHHNPILNWAAVADQGISFTYLKATEGTSHVDRNYPYNHDLARKANVRVGTYHFYTFALSGKEQASHFIKTAKCISGDLIPAIDVEHSQANPFSQDKAYVASVIRELKILEKELYNYFGVRPVIYTNKDCYKLYIKDNFPTNIIWMCDLDKEPSSDINWRIWQFSHKGTLTGVNEDIDLNYYRYSFNEFKELLLP